MWSMRTPHALAATVLGLALLAASVPATSAPSATAPAAPLSAPHRALPAAAAPDEGPVPAEALSAKVKKVTLRVDAAAGVHPISPLIYGVNFASRVDGLDAAFAVPLDRWGGNSTSRYNYLNDTTNTGQDWYFENIVSDPDETLTAFVDADRRAGSASLVTVPMIGWVSKDSPAEHPFLCSFPKTAFPTQNDVDYWDANCGNGVNGSTRLTADPTTTSITAGAGFDTAMVASLVAKYGTAAEGGVGFYALDNEPVLWNSTHRDVHPAPLNASELWTTSTATATAVKAADPTAKVLGPSDWGWCAYFFSADEDCGQSPLPDARGGLPLGAWYLKQFAASDAGSGTRTLDYFDEHYYPQANNVALSGKGSVAVQALRLRSTRSLWDPTYADESWISDANGRVPLAWIRTMKAWTDQYYPGTKTAITEYNWGGLESVNGALAQADVLGIFGREGLDLATLWGPGGAREPWAYAFRMYRNYDGHAHQFGDSSVMARSSNQGRLSVYAATRGSDGALTVMVVNKTHSTIPSTLSVKNFPGASKAAVYRYSSAHTKRIVKTASVKVRSGAIKTRFPGYSITLLVLAHH